MNFAPVLIKVAIDGDIIINGNEADISNNQNNRALSSTLLENREELDFISKFKKAERQIVIQDRISERAHLLSARGSTKAGEALEKCLMGK